MAREGRPAESPRGQRPRWEQRWHPLRREWVVVAAHRNERPWTGEVLEERAPPPSYDPACHFCPGNLRAGGEPNPAYESVFVFDNDFPVVGEKAPDVEEGGSGVHRRRPARGVARVLCYDPRHDVHLAQLPPEATETVFRALREQDIELSQRPDVRNILAFENRGPAVGVSNPHPHCQIYAVDFVFRNIERELEATAAHRAESGRSLFEDILQAELETGERVVASNEHAVAFVPFFARWAYEVMILPRRTRPTLGALDDLELLGLARAFHRVVTLYARLHGIPFPYVMAVHEAPCDGQPHPDFRVHLEILPPLRRPGLVKYLAGPEIGGGNFMSDTWPEEKADELRRAGEEG